MLVFSKRLIAATLLMLALPIAHAADYREGEQYIRLDKPVSAAPAAVEFFSFYCGPCYKFAETYRVTSTVSQALPVGKNLVKYHVSQMGKFGNELTEAWAVATVLGVEDKIEGAMFEAVQKQHAINSIEDIQKLFATVGIPAAIYENTRHSMLVKGWVAKQNDAVKAFNVTSTPSLYIDGKYKIQNTGIVSTSIEDYAKEYASAVLYLLDTQP